MEECTEKQPPESCSTFAEYILNCEVKVNQKTVWDEVLKKTYPVRQVLLIPQDSDHTTYFLTAWLPADDTEKYEITGFISSPIASPCRFAISRRNHDNPEKHFLYVMSVGVEEELLKFYDAKKSSIRGRFGSNPKIKVRIMPETHDEYADGSRLHSNE